MAQRKLAVVGNRCVACGNCASHCPLQAISIDRGIRAVVDSATCVGCQKCERACPAGVITMKARENHA